ncbi:hypothetical protein M405DRAFT_866421 [Rhizopogon salebrosus TDB-379]|nr:hypothetical protein M405DRAFT_866421 [Rhizopogon salebrosus TDB-379]
MSHPAMHAAPSEMRARVSKLKSQHSRTSSTLPFARTARQQQRDVEPGRLEPEEEDTSGIHDLERVEVGDKDEEDGKGKRQDEGEDRIVEDDPAQCLSRPMGIVISVHRGLHSKR